jgi:hypothetical protein
MSVTILATLLCLAILVSAVVAGRSSHRAHRGRAACWNVLGIACLVAGLFALGSWTRTHVGPSHHERSVTRFTWPEARLRVDVSDDVHLPRLRVFTTAVARASDDEGGAAEPAVPRPAAEQNATPANHVETPEAAPATEEPAEEEMSASHLDAAPGVELPADVETSASEPEAAPDQELLDGALPLELRAQVQIDYAARPEWVEQADRDVGPVHQIAVSSGPYVRQRLARRELDVQLKRMADEYINELVGNPRAADWLGYDAASLRERFIAPDKIFDEQVISPSFGRMYQSHALLELGAEFHEEVEHAWHAIVARAQLVKVALAAVAVLGTLVLVCGYFHADTATKGFYTRRLKFVTLVAILGLVASGILAARSIPWLWP